MIKRKIFLIRKHKWHRILKKNIVTILEVKDKFSMFWFIQYKI